MSSPDSRRTPRERKRGTFGKEMLETPSTPKKAVPSVLDTVKQLRESLEIGPSHLSSPCERIQNDYDSKVENIPVETLRHDETSAPEPASEGDRRVSRILFTAEDIPEEYQRCMEMRIRPDDVVLVERTHPPGESDRLDIQVFGILKEGKEYQTDRIAGPYICKQRLAMLDGSLEHLPIKLKEADPEAGKQYRKLPLAGTKFREHVDSMISMHDSIAFGKQKSMRRRVFEDEVMPMLKRAGEWFDDKSGYKRKPRPQESAIRGKSALEPNSAQGRQVGQISVGLERLNALKNVQEARPRTRSPKRYVLNRETTWEAFQTVQAQIPVEDDTPPPVPPKPAGYEPRRRKQMTTMSGRPIPHRFEFEPDSENSDYEPELRPRPLNIKKVSSSKAIRRKQVPVRSMVAPLEYPIPSAHSALPTPPNTPSPGSTRPSVMDKPVTMIPGPFYDWEYGGVDTEYDWCAVWNEEGRMKPNPDVDNLEEPWIGESHPMYHKVNF